MEQRSSTTESRPIIHFRSGAIFLLSGVALAIVIACCPLPLAAAAQVKPIRLGLNRQSDVIITVCSSPLRFMDHGSIVLNRRSGFWGTYKWYVAGGLLVFLAQSVAILGLLWHRARRKNVEAQLRSSEERFSKSFRQSPLVKTMTRVSDGHYIDVNDTFELQTGWSRDEVIGRTSTDIGFWVDPGQKSVFLKQLLTSGNVRDFEAKLHRKNGQIWTVLLSAAVIDISGEQCILSVIADISERKAAEDLLSIMSRRLIEAQEEERTRIARELHDDIGQRMVILGVNLETLKRDIPASGVKAKNRVEEVCQAVSDLVSDVQAISHRLHSSKLEYFGLEVASASFCRELSEQKKVKIHFTADRVPETVPIEVSLCLYRVLQEALNNAVKHSGVHEFEVSLVGTTNEIRLTVRDFGRGFDFNVASRGQGLGLTSMKERLNLVDGVLSIDSKPQRGTTVLARVPLKPWDENAGAVA